MWSTIGATTARQARAAGSLLVRRAALLALQAGARTATTSIVQKVVIVPTGARIPALVVQGYATKASTKSRKTAKRGRATKAKKKTTAKKKAVKKKKPVKRAKKTTKHLTEEEKQALKIKLLKKRALLKEPDRLPTTQWTVYFSQRVKEETAGKKRDEDLPSLKSIMQKIAAEYKALSAAELEVRRSGSFQNVPYARQKLTKYLPKNRSCKQPPTRIRLPMTPSSANGSRATRRRRSMMPTMLVVSLGVWASSGSLPFPIPAFPGLLSAASLTS